MKSHKTITPADPSITENLALRRMGKAESKDAQERMDVVAAGDGILRQPRKLSELEEDKKEVPVTDDKKENSKSKVRRSADRPLFRKLFKS